MASILFRLFMILGMVFPGTLPGQQPKPVSADWCQCAIFILNYLGIKQIPGEYWTASSLAVPDESGKTWMEYQGYSRRSPDEIPQPGDLLVISGGGEVITVQTWDGAEHLVPVPVDVWAGHIGIVEDVQLVEKLGKSFLQITLLSANWGVNARPAGVLGSCYNVDESIFLLPVGYKMTQFFYATDPAFMRDRIINRATRWSYLGLAPNSLTTLDGYPITPTGFISAALQETSKKPLTPELVDSRVDFSEIFIDSVQPGDILQFEGEGSQTGFGIISAVSLSIGYRQNASFLVISMPPDGRVVGPEHWNLIRRKDAWFRVLANGENFPVQFYRYKHLPGYLLIDPRGISWVSDDPLHASISFSIMNAGGKEIEINNLYMQLRYQDDMVGENQPEIKSPSEPKIHLKGGEVFTYSYSPEFLKAGEYGLDVFYEWQGKIFKMENAALISVQ